MNSSIFPLIPHFVCVCVVSLLSTSAVCVCMCMHVGTICQQILLHIWTMCGKSVNCHTYVLLLFPNIIANYQHIYSIVSMHWHFFFCRSTFPFPPFFISSRFLFRSSQSTLFLSFPLSQLSLSLSFLVFPLSLSRRFFQFRHAHLRVSIVRESVGKCEM